MIPNRGSDNHSLGAPTIVKTSINKCTTNPRTIIFLEDVYAANANPAIRLRIVVNPAKFFLTFDCDLSPNLALIQSPKQELFSFLNRSYPVTFVELATKCLRDIIRF